MTRTDTSLNEYMNNLRQQRNRQAGSLETSGALAARPTSVVSAAGATAAAAARKRGRPPKGNQESRPGPSRTVVELSLLTAGLEIAAHLQTELTAEENEVLSTIPTTKLMVETLELPSRALVASRTVIEELERVTTVTVPRLKKEVTEANQAAKASAEMVEKLKAQVDEKQAAVKAQEGLTKNLEAQLKEGADREEALKAEVAKCHDFMLRISEEYFRLGIRQAACLHGAPLEDDRYDIEKIVVDGKLVPANLDDNLDEETEAETPGPQPNASFEELMNNVP